MPKPIPLESLNHVAIVTTRLEASRKFYKEVLGFREVSRPNFNFTGAWLYNHGLMIHLIGHENRVGGVAGGEIQTRENHIALHTNDLAACERLLTEHGVPFRKNYVPDRNITQLFFHDPDGFHIEVGTYPALPPFID